MNWGTMGWEQSPHSLVQLPTDKGSSVQLDPWRQSHPQNSFRQCLPENSWQAALSRSTSWLA